MGDNNNTQSIADYLAQLLKDKKQLAAFPNVFVHMERLLDDGKLESENYRYMENTSAISELKMAKSYFKIWLNFTAVLSGFPYETFN